MKNLFLIILLLGFSTVIFAQPKDYTVFYETHPGNVTVHANGILGLLNDSENQFRVGNSEQAILILDNALAQYPFLVETYLKRAELLTRMGRQREAKEDLETARRLNPYVTDFYLSKKSLGILQWMDFDPQRYEALIENGLSSETGSLLDRTISNKMEGDFGSAISQIEQLFRNISNPEPWLYDLRGHLYLLTGNYQQAIANYTEAIEAAPDVATFYLHRGVARLFTYNRSAACEDLERSSDLGLTHSEVKLINFCYN